MVERPVFVVSAPSGGGKNSLINILLKEEPRIRHSISSTTRSKRANEKDGMNYHFLTKDEFEKRIRENKFLEYARVLDNYYGTEYAEIERIFNASCYPVLDIDIQGADALRKKRLPLVTFFIVPPSLEVLEKRLRARASESEEEVLKRLQLARVEIEEKNKFDHVIVNDDLKTASDELIAVVRRHLV
ncbi:MAG TPA: guanylate kinase [Turneriella sp.]|nr:guanylate kinase [Turneriella sp.]